MLYMKVFIKCSILPQKIIELLLFYYTSWSLVVSQPTIIELWVPIKYHYLYMQELIIWLKELPHHIQQSLPPYLNCQSYSTSVSALDLVLYFCQFKCAVICAQANERFSTYWIQTGVALLNRKWEINEYLAFAIPIMTSDSYAFTPSALQMLDVRTYRDFIYSLEAFMKSCCIQ